MSFLDRFKPQPRWKHADALVRIAAIPEIPDDDGHRGVVAELAAGDEDVRVRRAAIARLADVSALVRLARTERDADLRRELSDRLVAIANYPAETGADAARALDGLDDEKHFSTIAKQSPHAAVRTAALGRVQDVKALSNIARHGLDPQTALEAVARISEPAELLTVAVKTDHKDAGIAALERAVDPTAGAPARETLDGLATRARNKSVAKRARAMVQAIDEAETARRAAFEQWRQRVDNVVARAEAVAIRPSATDAPAMLADTEQAWAQLAGDGTFEIDTDTVGRYGLHIAAAKAGLARLAQEREARRLEVERQEAARAARASLCELVENARAEDALEAVERARAEWEGLPGPALHEAAHEGHEDSDELNARFEEACRRAAVRHQNRQDVQATHVRLEALSAEADHLSSEQAFSEDAWTAVQREWQALHPKSDALDPAIGERYAAAESRVRQREEERRAAAERALTQQAQRVEQLCDRATTRAAAEDLTLREADRLARELRAAIDAPPALPERDRHALIERLRAAHALVSPKVHELRELDEWKRFANAAVQEELIAKTEALRTKYGFDAPEGPKPEDLDEVARGLHEIQERWKQVAEAPRAQAQALWHRYRQAADPIQAKVREFFAQRMEERKGNLERKLALIERAEALSESTGWIKTADELKQLHTEWRALGPVPRTETRVTWKRFREACDKFFTRRNEDLAQRKETWSANLAKKEALCARAEELSTSRDWEKAASEIRRLQVEWKNVGPIRRTKSEAMWQRFRSAADTFFDRYKRRDQIDLEAKQGEREALVTELESLGPAGGGDVAGAVPSDIAPDMAAPAPIEATVLFEQVRSLRSRWNQTSPTVRQGADPLSARFMGGLERLLAAHPGAFRGTELDVEANRQKMETLCNRVEGFVSGTGAAAASPSQALATMLREALASNTIGGRAGEESKWRAMAEDVRQAQAAWSRLGPVPGHIGRELGDRFHQAVTRFYDQFRRIVPPQQTAPRGKPVGARS